MHDSGDSRAHIAPEQPRGLPSLSVVCAVHQHGGLTAALLQSVRHVADEIVVAFDDRTPTDDLGPLEDVADVLVGFEFSGRNRFRSWLREQASGDWLLLLDNDELPSAELLRQLPDLIGDRNVSGYVTPRWWLYGGPTQRLDTAPWSRDEILRLVRNDGRLWFPGIGHTGAVCDPPIRYVDAPLIHLDLILRSEHERLEKVRHYDRSQTFGQLTFNGRPINEGFYLPEVVDGPPLATLDPEDSDRVVSAMSHRNDSYPPRFSHSVAAREEVETWWVGRPMSPHDYSGFISVVADHDVVIEGSRLTLDVTVTNTGFAVWPATSLSRGGPVINLSYHWERSDGTTVVFDGSRTPLSSRVIPNQSTRLQMRIDVPRGIGEHVLVIDLVHENARWFGIDQRMGVTVARGAMQQTRRGTQSDIVSIEDALQDRRRSNTMNGLLGLIDADHTDRSTIDARGFGGRCLAHMMDVIARRNPARVVLVGIRQQLSDLEAAVAANGGEVLLVVGDDEISSAGAVTGCAQFRPDLIVVESPAAAMGTFCVALAEVLPENLVTSATFLVGNAYLDAALDVAMRWKLLANVEIDGLLTVGNGLLIGRIDPSETLLESVPTVAIGVDPCHN